MSISLRKAVLANIALDALGILTVMTTAIVRGDFSDSTIPDSGLAAGGEVVIVAAILIDLFLLLRLSRASSKPRNLLIWYTITRAILVFNLINGQLPNIFDRSTYATSPPVHTVVLSLTLLLIYLLLVAVTEKELITAFRKKTLPAQTKK